MIEMNIDGRTIADNQPPYVIAEVSANHNGSIEKAKQSISQARKCGADAVKIQTYTADTMTIDCDQEEFRIRGGLWDGNTLYQLYRQAETPFAWHRPLFEHARQVGITLFSTPFDESAVDLLEDLNAPAYKIASFELTDLPLLRYVAATGKPMILSTGLATLSEIEEAVTCIREAGCDQFALLHCISSYPAPVAESNLLTIPDIQRRFDTVSGLSDHSLTSTASVAAVALGASIIEKHFILDRSDGGPDAAFSIEPQQLTDLCHTVRDAWQALGKAGYELKAAEQENLRFRRSLYCVADIRAGEPLTRTNIRRIRPGHGLAPKHFDSVLGRRAKVDILRGTPLRRELLE